MPTTRKAKGEGDGERLPGGNPRRCSNRGRRAAIVPQTLLAVACGVLCLGSTPACAQRLQILAGVGSELAWTNNAALGSATALDDTVVSIRPRLELRAEGPRLRFGGTAALNAIAYVDGTQNSRVLPEADLGARLEAVERLFFIEAALRASQTSVNPFGARPDATSTQNRLSTAQARLSPSIERAFSEQSRLRIRADQVWTRESGDDLAPETNLGGGTFARYSMAIEHDPRPFGWRTEAERSQTDYDDGEPRLTFDLFRVGVERALGADLVVGLRAGVERNSFIVGDDTSSIYGVHVGWRPSERTLLAAIGERRYFGTGWRLAFDHRQPRLAFGLLLSRALATTPQALLEAPATDNLAALFDAMFTTRIPDAEERARAVQEFLARNALPAATLSPLNLYTRRVSLVTTRSAIAALNGVRSSISVSAFRTLSEDAPGSAAVATGSVLDNNLQTGASVVASHRLTSVTSVSASVDYSRVRALDSADRTRQAGARLQLSTQIGPKTSVVGGLRWRDIDSNVVLAGRERVVSAGLDHRF